MTSGFLVSNQKAEKNNSVETDLPAGDFEAVTNLVGLFDLLLRVDRRINPQEYLPIKQVQNHD